MSKLLLIDGNSLANRAFFALPPFTTADGVNTNAVFGFLNMYFRMLEEEQPTYVAVAFDKSGPTFRHEQFDDYKGTRKGTPDELRPQLPLLREVLTALGVPWFQLDRYEADDLIGTMAALAEAEGLEAIVVTGDRDALQLVSDKTTVIYTRRGISEVTRYTPELVAESYGGLTPEQLIDLKGLMGDTSDNIPGLPGVGEKTAIKLLQQFGSLEEVLARPDEVGGKKLQETVRTQAELARTSKWLATIKRDVPVACDVKALAPKIPDVAAAQELFTRLEFRTLLPKLGAEGELSATPTNLAEAAVLTEAWLAAREAGEFIAFLPAYDAKKKRYIGAAAAAADGEPVWADQVADFGPLFAKGVNLVMHDGKAFLVEQLRQGAKAPNLGFDTALAGYLLDPSRSNYEVADLARAHGVGEVAAEGAAAAAYWGSRAAALLPLQEKLTEALAEAGLTKLYEEVEFPLLGVLAEMEAVGIGVDRAGLEAMGAELEGRIEVLTQEIHALAGVEFNINSPKQLGEILFDKLGLPVIKKTKTGYSTDAEVLETLEPQHEIASKLLDYRTLTKLKGTYVDGLKDLIEDGRIHTTFAQTVAATGRLSSVDPNLQNIPIRVEEGRRIRKVFVAAPGRRLLAADYSQIELRVLAHYSGDEGLVEAFTHDQDVHKRTAAEVFGVPLSEVTAEMRDRAKTVNFGLVYGQGEFGLARQLGVTRAEAKTFIEQYFATYPGVKAYMDGKIAEAHELGYVTTLLGRRRFLPEINARIFHQRQNAERAAINTPIQGTAADLIKLAMVKVAPRLAASGLKAELMLQVHDELVFEVDEADVEALATLVKEEMEGAMQLAVPLKVAVKVGPNWYEMEPML